MRDSLVRMALAIRNRGATRQAALGTWYRRRKRRDFRCVNVHWGRTNARSPVRHRTDRPSRVAHTSIAVLSQRVNGPDPCVESISVRSRFSRHFCWPPAVEAIRALAPSCEPGARSVAADTARARIHGHRTRLLLALNALANQQLLAISGTPLCDIAVYNIRYATVGGANEATTASGAMMVPLGSDPDCRGTARSSCTRMAPRPTARST